MTEVIKVITYSYESFDVNLITAGLRISGHGSAIPSQVKTNDDLFSSTANWVTSRLGIDERRHLTSSESFVDLCEKAALNAILNSHSELQDFEGIIVATSTPEMINPSMASMLHGRLGMPDSAMTFDIQAVCAGFVYGIGTVAAISNLSGTGKWLLIGADQFSRITDFNSRDCVFFGDAAAAMVIEKTKENNKCFFEFGSHGKGWEGFTTSEETRTFKMNSRSVFESASTRLPTAIRGACSAVGISVQDVSHFFVHQPSKPVLDALEKTLEIPEGRLYRNIRDRANTAGATVPLLFSEMQTKGIKIKNEEWVCFAAIGAGWVWGVALMQWQD